MRDEDEGVGIVVGVVCTCAALGFLVVILAILFHRF